MDFNIMYSVKFRGNFIGPGMISWLSLKIFVVFVLICVPNVLCTQNNKEGRTVNGTSAASGRARNLRTREQQVFTIFEAMISTLESKLQRIENLDRAVEHLMRKIETIDDRLTQDIKLSEHISEKIEYFDQKLSFLNTLFDKTFKLKPCAGTSEINVDTKFLTPEVKIDSIDETTNSFINKENEENTTPLLIKPVLLGEGNSNSSKPRNNILSLFPKRPKIVQTLESPELNEPKIKPEYENNNNVNSNNNSYVKLATFEELRRKRSRMLQNGEQKLEITSQIIPDDTKKQEYTDINNIKIQEQRKLLETKFDIISEKPPTLENENEKLRKQLELFEESIPRKPENDKIPYIPVQRESENFDIFKQTEHQDTMFEENKEVANDFGQKIKNMDDKISNINSKLDIFLQNEDVFKSSAINMDIYNLVSREISRLRDITTNFNEKLQFHIDFVSRNFENLLDYVSDIHEAVFETESTSKYNGTKLVTSKVQRSPKLTKIDELLWHTQRQERAIGEIHEDLRAKTNKIIQNLDIVEKKLKIQEDNNAPFSEKYESTQISDVESDGFTTIRDKYNPTDLSENRPNINTNYYTETKINETYTTETKNPFLEVTTFYPLLNSNSKDGNTYDQNSASATENNGNNSGANFNSTFKPTTYTKRKEGIIYPSVKNKPVVQGVSGSSSGNNSDSVDGSLGNIKDFKGYSCMELLAAGGRTSGVYHVQIRGTRYWYLQVYCEQELAGGGWTVIQRRDDYGEPRENFNRDWFEYKSGFGDPSKEFWLGNENIYMLTSNDDHILRVELEDFDGNTRYAQYSHFKVYSESEYYRLELDGYSGTAGDSLNDPWYGSNNTPFSTYNRDNDRSSLNCASMLKGGWWWKSCGRGLNGLYLNDAQDLTARQGIVWFRWRGWDYTLKRSVMMIRPKGPHSTTTPTT